MPGAPAYMNMPTTLGVGGLRVTTTIQPQTPRLGMRTGKRFQFFVLSVLFVFFLLSTANSAHGCALGFYCKLLKPWVRRT